MNKRYKSESQSIDMDFFSEDNFDEFSAYDFTIPQREKEPNKRESFFLQNSTTIIVALSILFIFVLIASLIIIL